MTATPTPDTAPGLVASLMAADQAGTITYLGLRANGARYAVKSLAGDLRDYPTDQMRAWLAGWQTGHATADTSPIDRPELLTALRAVLVNPTPADTRRLAIFAAMEETSTTMTQLEEHVGRTRKTISEALRFGGGGDTIAEIVAYLGKQPGQARRPVGRMAHADTPTVAVSAPDAPVAAIGAQTEPSGLRRARALAIFHERGLLTLVAPRDPDKARRAQRSVVDRAGRQHRLPAVQVLPWLVGLGDVVNPAAANAIHVGRA
jgi:hypothetical protein